MKGGDNKDDDERKGDKSALGAQDYDNISSIPFRVKRR
jgi:hypothetical protein